MTKVDDSTEVVVVPVTEIAPPSVSHSSQLKEKMKTVTFETAFH